MLLIIGPKVPNEVLLYRQMGDPERFTLLRSWWTLKDCELRVFAIISDVAKSCNNKRAIAISINCNSITLMFF